MLGGRAAEELVFGQPTTGAESDLQQVTSLAQRMMVQWGMSDEVGLAAYGSDAAAYTRAPLPEARDYAEATTAEMDRAVRKLLDQAYSRARDPGAGASAPRRAGRRASGPGDARWPATRRPTGGAPRGPGVRQRQGDGGRRGRLISAANVWRLWRLWCCPTSLPTLVRTVTER